MKITDKTEARQFAADRRAIMAELTKPEHCTKPGMVLLVQPHRRRAHLIVHQGQGPKQNWMSQTMDAANFNKFRASMIGLGELPLDLTAEMITALKFLAKEPGRVVDIVSPQLAVTLRIIEKDYPGLVSLVDSPATKDHFKPYFAAIITTAGLKALKKGGRS